MKHHLFPLILAAFFFPACANFWNKPQRSPAAPVAQTEKLEIRSLPAGAKAKLSTGEECTTPCAFTKPVDQPLFVTFRKEGYRVVTRRVQSEPAGAAKHLSPNPLTVRLQPDWEKEEAAAAAKR
jgi:hypothetical protein